jgi:transcriptional regulator GlxA family with amidase domain
MQWSGWVGSDEHQDAEPTLSRAGRHDAALWVAGTRVRRAQRLLEATALSVEQVAAEVGFRSSAVLREHFRQTVGTSPQAYRRSFTTR